MTADAADAGGNRVVTSDRRWDLSPDEFAEVVVDAARAPSVHNSQPWRFRLTGTAIEVHLDPQRVLAATDPTGRNARISCGAASYTLALALAARGTPAIVRIPATGTLLALLVPGTPRPPTPQEKGLHRAVGRRHSNRQPFLDTAVPATARTALVDAARAEGGWLDLIVDRAALESAAGLVGTADGILNDDPAYRAELRAWTRTGPQAVDGVVRDLGGPAPHPAELLVRRDFGGLGSPRPYEEEPTLGALGVSGWQPHDDVRAGMVLQRVLLSATTLGLAASLFSQPIDVPDVRARLSQALGRHTPPHILVRFGYAAAIYPTLRRPVEDVIA
jgi:hypothetical protein